MLLDGAAVIMKQKNQKVQNVEEIDIDKMIEEGLEKHRKIQEMAQNQVEMIQSDNTFNFTQEKVDCFNFQDKNFKEEKAKLAEMIQAEQPDEEKDQMTRIQRIKLRQGKIDYERI